MPAKRSQLATFLASVDWPQAIHRGAVFVRAIRGDGRRLQEDHERETNRAERTTSLALKLARMSLACTKETTGNCSCAICEEERGQR